jgi:E3 SUMO-protein ligase PIAS1
MQHHRHTVLVSLRVSDHPILARAHREPSLKVMVFCAGEGHGRQDVAFPHQSEIKVNSGEIKANLRGLKNKPGSTRPVDITKELRLNLPTYSNSVEMTYALTTKAGGESPQVSCHTPLFSFPEFHQFFCPFCAVLNTISADFYFRSSTLLSTW